MKQFTKIIIFLQKLWNNSLKLKKQFTKIMKQFTKIIIFLLKLWNNSLKLKKNNLLKLWNIY